MSLKKYSKSRKEGWMSIPDYFDGKSVFITGATGFLGKVLVEKLLRSCSQVHKIYILLRPKKGKSLEERLGEMTALPLFTKVKRENRGLLDKIIPVRGDVSELNLGLSEEDRSTLIREVSIIFHVAACVRFDDSLKPALLLNTRGTLQVCLLAKEMKKLESLTHVSTAYCNTHKDVIEETIYPPPGDWRVLIKLAETLDKHELDVYAPKILGRYPNTYTFTKGLAEHVVKEFQDVIPISIFRPTIVISSLLEPMPGWVDNFNGPVGLIIACAKGIVRIVYSDPKISADYFPVDIAVKAMIVTNWFRAMCREEESKLLVVNCSSHDIQTVTQEELVNVATHVVDDVPLNDALWYPTGAVTSSKLFYYLSVFLFHLLPAIAVDIALRLTKKKPMLVKLQRKIFVANMALSYFLTQQWTFKSDKLWMVESEILDSDRPAFGFKVPTVDVIEYFKNCAFGAREYLLKEDNTELPEAKKHTQKLFWLDRGLKFGLMVVAAVVAHQIRVLPMIRAYLNQLINFLIKILS